MGLSRRAFGKLVGVSGAAVQKAVNAGRIELLPDGTIDPDAALKRWRATTDPARSKASTAKVNGRKKRAAVVSTEQDAVDAVTLIRRVLAEEGADSSGEIDFGMARIAETILKARERELKMAERRKELVPLAKVREHVSRAFIGFRQAVQRLPSRHVAAIAAELGCDAGALDAALSKAIAAELDGLSTPLVRA